MGLDNAVSSLREVGWNGGGGGGPAAAGGRRRLAASVVLFESLGMTAAARSTLNGADRPISSAPASTIARARRSSIRHVAALRATPTYQGDCRSTARAATPNLGGVDGPGELGAARRRRRRRRPAAAAWRRLAADWGGTRVVLYERPELPGRSYTREQRRAARTSANIGFNDRASSMRVERGYWMFCTDANFMGDCRTFGPGDYPNAVVGLTNRISSGRRISNDYPYNAPPQLAATDDRAITRRACRSSTTSPACAASSRSAARSRSSACRRTGTGRAISPRSTCRTTATGSSRSIRATPKCSGERCYPNARRDSRAGRHRRLLPQAGGHRADRARGRRQRREGAVDAARHPQRRGGAHRARRRPRRRDGPLREDRAARILGGLNWAGVNTGVISSRRPRPDPGTRPRYRIAPLPPS